METHVDTSKHRAKLSFRPDSKGLLQKTLIDDIYSKYKSPILTNKRACCPARHSALPNSSVLL